MRSFLSITVLLFTASGVLGQSLTINTPANLVVCEPALINWSGGVPPYFVSSVLPGADPTGQALEDFPTTNGTNFSWNVNIAAGTQIGLTLRDSTGNTAQSAPVTINPGPDASCVGKPLSSGGASVTLPTSTASSGATTGGSTGGTTAATTGATTGTGTSHAASGTGSASATSTHTNAASSNTVKIGTAGIIGAALAALLA